MRLGVVVVFFVSNSMLFYIVKLYGLMAKVLYGGLISELKGSAGGTTFQSGRYGFTMKNKGMGRKVASPAQSYIRQSITAASKYWQLLTPGERDAWDAIAPSWPYTDKFGNPGELTGFNLFIQLSTNLLLIGEPINPTASLPAPLFTFSSFSVSASVGSGSIIVSFSPDPVDTDCFTIVRAAAPANAGASLVASGQRIISVNGIGFSDGTDISSDYIKKFGAFPPEGSKLHVTLSVISKLNGTPAPWMNSSCIVST